MSPSYIQTPVFRSIRHPHVSYKMDCYQPTGCFKLRGMYQAALTYREIGAKRFISSSGGNAGFSLAFACRDLGIPLHVVVPDYAPDFMVRKITGLGATVEKHGEVWNDANDYALQMVAPANGTYYVHPYDDPNVWRGNSTIIDECARQMKEPDELVVAVGGGGFLCGIMQGLERNGWNNVQVIAAETYGAASFHAAQREGKPVTIPQLTSIATSLGSRRVAEEAINWTKKRTIRSYLMPDADAVKASSGFAEEFNVITEPACGAALSYVFCQSPDAIRDRNILIMICGGVTCNVNKFAELQRQYVDLYNNH